MAYDPTKDGMVIVNGFLTATDPTTSHTVARLLQEQLGLPLGPAAVTHLLTSPKDKDGVVTQIFSVTMPLSLLKEQYRTGPQARKAIDAAAPTHDLAANPRVIVHILPEFRETTVVMCGKSPHQELWIFYGVSVPWQ